MNVQHPERSKATFLRALDGGGSPGRGRGPERPMRGLMAVALVLVSLAASQAVAEPAKKHDPQYRSEHAPQREHAGSDGRNHGAYADRRNDGDRHRSQPTPSHYYRDTPRYSPPPVVHHRPSHDLPGRSYRYAPPDRGYPWAHHHEPLRSERAARRHYFVPGHAIPPVYRRHVGRLPPHLSHRLPPTPRGYRVGYYQGYSVVYDPLSFTVLSVLDLLTH